MSIGGGKDWTAGNQWALFNGLQNINYIYVS